MAEHTTRQHRPPQRPRRSGARTYRAEVTARHDLTPHMRRLTVTAEEFADYAPVGPDEYLGLLLPRHESAPLALPSNDGTNNIRAAVAALPEDERPDLRWYTLRAHRPHLREIDIDFVVHGDEGPGTRFANRANAGTVLGIQECTALYAPLPEVKTRVLIGDESAIPAIARILETTTAAETHVFVEIADSSERQNLPGDIVWLEREGAAHGVRLREALRTAPLPDVIDYAWVCGERSAVQDIRRQLVGRGVSKDRITFSGYWRLGEARG